MPGLPVAVAPAVPRVGVETPLAAAVIGRVGRLAAPLWAASDEPVVALVLDAVDVVVVVVVAVGLTAVSPGFGAELAPPQPCSAARHVTDDRSRGIRFIGIPRASCAAEHACATDAAVDAARRLLVISGLRLRCRRVSALAPEEQLTTRVVGRVAHPTCAE
jgi:hypothetical protein